MARILVVEDHPLVAEATASLLRRLEQGIDIVAAATAEETLRLLDEPIAWSRVFFDLWVPGAYGLSLAKEVHRRGLAGTSCVISAFDRADFIEEVRRLGFLGYIVKAAPVVEVTSALASALRGEHTFPASTARSSSPRLTRRQTEILELVQTGLSSKHIARRLGLVEGTVNNQVAAMLLVLRAESRTHAVARAIELGLLTIVPGDSLLVSQARRDGADRA